MNRRYQSDAAIVLANESMASFAQNELLYYQYTTLPGAKVPHGWLLKNGQRKSMLYVCGHGHFALLTGNRGGVWRESANRIQNEFAVLVCVIMIGPGQDYEDPYGDFARLSEISENGSILLRPDMHAG